MRRIDSHQHLLDMNRFPYSWCAGVPAINRSFLLDDYLSAAAGLDIEKTVFVEGDVDEPYELAEARYAQALAEASPLIAGIVATARPERDDFPLYLEALLKLPKLRGIRRVLHVVADETSQSALFAENIRRLATYNLSFDLCVLARQLPLAIELVQKCPQVQFILDHCGVPDVMANGLDPWRSHISELASLSNVACKVSGIVAYAQDNWTVNDLRPWTEHVVASFGWERVVWGADWPVCTLKSSLKQWVESADRLFAAATESQRDSMFYKNAERIYRL